LGFLPPVRGKARIGGRYGTRTAARPLTLTLSSGAAARLRTGQRPVPPGEREPKARGQET
jgi:hypothetical protein